MFERALHSGDHAVSRFDSSLDGTDAAPSMPFGRRAFIVGTAGAIAATAFATTAEAAAVPQGASYYETVAPVRLADTRTYAPYASVAKNFRRLTDRAIEIDIKNSPYVNVPADAVAVVVSVAALYSGPPGWVAVVPSGSTNVVSNINMEGGDGAVANLATVKIGANGKIIVRAQERGDVVVDIQGVYRATTTKVVGGRMQFLPATRRALSDTRMTPGTWLTVGLGSFLPATASAVVMNVTVSRCRSGGFLTVAAIRSPAEPEVSNLNFVTGDERAAAAIVKLGNADGAPSIEIYCAGDTQVFVDVTGYFTGPGDTTSEDGLFVPIEPNRVMDTRRASPDFARTGKRRLWPGWTRAFELPNGTPGTGFGLRSQMKGVAMNATLVTSMQSGFVTVLPARTQRQFVSNLNPTRRGHTVANHVITEVSTAGVEMYALCGGDLIADVAGWYVGSPKQTVFSNAPFDPPASPAAFNWFLSVPRMQFANFVVPNLISGDPVVDSGNTWHWTNTGLLGDVDSSIVVFGHRTAHRGPYRRQHELVAGDRLYIDTPDQRRFEYQFIREQLTNDVPQTILNAARTNAPGTTFTLVSCTGSSTIFDDQPRGGIRFRIVSTFQLVGWTDERPHGG